MKTSRYNRIDTARTVLQGFERELQNPGPSGLELKVPPGGAGWDCGGLM
jgi:hypothetical protein